MKVEIKSKWLEALRSGLYKQGRSSLKINDRFCCLGVLCDLYAKENNVSWAGTNSYNESYLFNEDTRNAIYLPKQVQEWAGLEEENPIIIAETSTSLAYLNDEGKTFEEIANLIDKSL